MIEDKQHFSIIIAEDDPDDRLLIKNAFEKLGKNINIFFVNDGEELLNHLNQIRNGTHISLPDLIILDLNMPKISGHQVITEIKKKAGFDSMNIVVLSTSSEKSDIEFCKNNGVNTFFTKPDSFEGLLHVMESIISK